MTKQKKNVYEIFSSNSNNETCAQGYYDENRMRKVVDQMKERSDITNLVVQTIDPEYTRINTTVLTGNCDIFAERVDKQLPMDEDLFSEKDASNNEDQDQFFNAVNSVFGL